MGDAGGSPLTQSRPLRKDRAESLFDLPVITDVEVQNRYPTPFLVVSLDDTSSLNDRLREIILGRAAVDPGVSLSNDGGWQSTPDFADWSGAPGAQLLDLAIKVADSATALETEQDLQRGGPAWKINAWANVNGPGHGNHPHHHPAAFWTGVYWVDDGGSGTDEPIGGELEIHDPRGVLPAFYAPRLRYALPGYLSAGGQDFFKPRTGTMVIFPAWLVHAVRAYAGSSLRISVAFNLSI
ncbi:MAG: hypothetical protein E7812_10065 [Phenylobacterium sp.]|nr:MAG: hypothetical protein E7812_10065 [Phenylobacterium sp.]